MDSSPTRHFAYFFDPLPTGFYAFFTHKQKELSDTCIFSHYVFSCLFFVISTHILQGC